MLRELVVIIVMSCVCPDRVLVLSWHGRLRSEKAGKPSSLPLPTAQWCDPGSGRDPKHRSDLRLVWCVVIVAIVLGQVQDKTST